MSARIDALQVALEAALGSRIATLVRDRGEITITVEAADYLAAKRDLAEHFRDDRDAYSDAKDPVCDRIIEAAEVWAAAVAWAPGRSDA